MNPTSPTGADVLVRSLYEMGVRVIFGMPGSHTVAIYDALHRHGGIRTILIRNEQAGAFAADGYARVTGKPGVICTTAGPGATNALTGIAEAWGDSTPVLLVTGQVNHDRLHQECGNYHEMDLEGILRPCTKYVGTAMSNAAIPAMVAKAFAAMTHGRPRPAALVLPQDLMAMPAGEVPEFRMESSWMPELDLAAIARAVALLREARMPIILAGGGAVWADAGDEIRELAIRLDCSVMTTLNGKGIVDERSPIALGHARSARSRIALPLADVMLAVGCRFTEVFTGFRKLQVPKRLIQIDIDAGQLGMNYPAEISVCSDAKKSLRAILNALPGAKPNGWAERWESIAAARLQRPEWLIDVLRANLPDDAVVFTDASEMAYRMHTDFPAYEPRSFFYPSNYIALGWGFPAAIGAAIALPNRVVVSFSGDGGFVMTCQELATAARYKLNLIAIVHNDSTYGAIKNLQRIRNESRYHDTELNNPDFVTLAQAFGVPGCRASDAQSFTLALQEALARGGPALIEVPDMWRYLRE